MTCPASRLDRAQAGYALELLAAWSSWECYHLQASSTDHRLAMPGSSLLGWLAGTAHDLPCKHAGDCKLAMPWSPLLGGLAGEATNYPASLLAQRQAMPGPACRASLPACQRDCLGSHGLVMSAQWAAPRGQHRWSSLDVGCHHLLLEE